MNSYLDDETGRIHHHHSKWEELKFNMWGKVKDRAKMLKQAIEFTGNHVLYGSYMKRVVDEWRYSCEHNLSFGGHNRRAWLGHAATALALGCPETITREAWGYLTQEQQDLANLEATTAIESWELRRRAANKQMEMFDA